MSEQITKCPVCGMGNVKKFSISPLDLQFTYVCPRCGKYNITDTVEVFMLREALNSKLSAWIRAFNERGELPPLITTGRIEELNSTLPDYGVLEKQRILLQNIKRKTEYPGQSVNLLLTNDFPLAWANNYREFAYHLDSLKDRNLIRGEYTISSGLDGIGATITPEGWEYLDKYESDIEERTQVFVAMSFNPELKSIWEDAIKPAITDAGYTPFRVDMEPHNERIDAKIMTEIKNSRFIVADFTENKHGVYFEAGYALGQGIPVIWCVKKEDLENLHFDTRQYGHIDWENEVELKEKLYNYICAIIGKRK
jgi:nucleoside 2-deoxyribosyltransferase